MSNKDIIAKIKAEIERLENYYTSVEWYVEALLSFLSTLESEKPIEGLEEEIDRIVKCEKEFMNFQCRSQLIAYIARHFAQWGAEHAKNGDEKPAQNDGPK